MRYFCECNTRDQRQIQKGFTLIEVMIVVAIVAILASIALPAYTDYIRRGQLQEAFTHLSDYRAKMEQYYQDNKNYGSGGTCASAASANTWNGFAPSSAKYFDFVCALAADAQSYSLAAGGRAGSPVVGYAYTIDQDGNQTTTEFKGVTVSGCNKWASRSSSDC